MKRKVLKASLIACSLPIATVFPLSSCGLVGQWDWLTSTNNNTEINYCLLIGQNEHTDSLERTRGTRRALGTLDESEETKKRTKDNPNLADPIPGSMEVTDVHGKNKRVFAVRELEHMEQKSITGAAWDPIQANASAGTWIAKHGSNLTFFVSNNDAMAEGAMWASNWIKGMPIFGYDANSTTLQWINTGYITGTVDQNPSSQAAVAMLMFRNFLEDRDEYWKDFTPSEKNHWFGYGGKDIKYKYTPLWNGIHRKDDEEEKKKDTHGFVDSYLFNSVTLVSQARAALTKCTPIAKLGEDYPNLNNIGNYVKPNGEAKQPADMFDQSTYIDKNVPSKHYKMCHTYSNKSEAFLIATMRPYFNEYARRLGLDLDPIEGDGTDETLVLNQINARPSNFDAYFICMAKTTTALQYIQACAKKAFEYENNLIGNDKRSKCEGCSNWHWQEDGWDDWNQRLDTPLFFWIRRPTKDDGSVDYDAMTNKYFKYTYYIGADSANGGDAQGELIKGAIKKWYTESLKKE